MAKHFDHFLLAGREAAHSASKSFAEGARNDVNPAQNSAQFHRPAAGGTDKAGSVTLVHHHEGVVLVSQVADGVHLGHIAVHGKDPIGHDQLRLGAGCISGLQLRLQVGHIVVRIAKAHRLAEAHPINDRSVVQTITDNGILITQQGLKYTPIGIKCRGI